jgi:DNA-binding CsgD family transcriptional regulator
MTLTPPVPLSIRVAAARVKGARGGADRLRRLIEQTPIPMVLVDSNRRHVDANRAARLAFRMSLEELRSYSVDDLTSPSMREALPRIWSELTLNGSVSGRYSVAGPGSCPLEIVFHAVANALPGVHAAAFAPADWPEDELDGDTDDGTDAPVALTPREIEVLTLAAHGFSGPEIARDLVLSPATVKTHFANIHGKLGVPNRTAAVARAMNLGVID